MSLSFYFSSRFQHDISFAGASDDEPTNTKQEQDVPIFSVYRQRSDKRRNIFCEGQNLIYTIFKGKWQYIFLSAYL